jgi:phosphoenolpyruvate-protein phosphotransferase (PTS system enzyme I)
MEAEKILTGVSISKGIAIGNAVCSKKKCEKELVNIPTEEIHNEIKRFRSALEKSKKDLQRLREKSISNGEIDIAEILDSHLEILQDPFLTEMVESKIKLSKQNIETVFQVIIQEYKKHFSKDPIFKERVTDFLGLSTRIVSYLQPIKSKKIVFSKDSIFVAEEIMPVDIMENQKKYIHALISQEGGKTSHSAIIARSRGIPYVADIDVRLLENCQKVVVDGNCGIVVINPSDKTIEKYNSLQKELEEKYKKLQKKISYKNCSQNNINVYANINEPYDIEKFSQQDIDGIGLFRSEYLLIGKNDFLKEEEQVNIYLKIAEKIKDKPFVIRLFDLGGDKIFKLVDDCFSSPNPSLGVMGIRFLLKHQEILRGQIRAIIRANVYNNIRMLVPLVTDIEEILELKQIITEERENLINRGFSISNKILLGCMIEVPSSAILCDIFVKEVDFLSIGTNDLSQYLLAADRNNIEVRHLYSSCHMAVLRLIGSVIKEGIKAKKEVIICGELASDPRLVQLFLELGATSLSVSCLDIHMIKDIADKVFLKPRKS